MTSGNQVKIPMKKWNDKCNLMTIPMKNEFPSGCYVFAGCP